MITGAERHIFFLGIGGIGMSALAKYYLNKGVQVSGYDRSRSRLTEYLEKEGAEIFYDESSHTLGPDVDLVIYTPAVSPSNRWWQKFERKGLSFVKRAQVLGYIADNYRVIAVAGTHGKTTTAAILTHLLLHAGIKCTAFVGGILTGYNTNCFIGDSDLLIAEADEYDRSFLSLSPDIAIVHAMDPDHLDIYGSSESMVESYNEFANRVTRRIYMNNALSGRITGKEIELYTYGWDNADIVITHYHTAEGKTEFTLDLLGRETGFSWDFPGRHNVFNATAAIAVADALGVPLTAIQEGIANFRGIQRRFEKCYENGNYILISDYAHHPEELKATISAAREMYASRHITGIFQPHLYSRTRDFAPGFASALDLLDTCYVMEIYPARETPLPGVSSEMILNEMTMKSKELLTREAADKLMDRVLPGVILVLGAGDLDECIPQWMEQLKDNAA